MAFLPKTKIIDRIQNGEILLEEEHFEEENLGPVSCDLRVGREAFVSGRRLPFSVDEEGFVTVEPGQFAIVMTYEYLCIPKDLVAFISLKLRYKLLGLINVSGFHVDPGFEGHLLFSVYNAGPQDIVLKHRQPVFQIFFSQLDGTADYDGSFDGQTSIPVERVMQLRGTSASLTGMDHRISEIESSLTINRAVLLGLLFTVIGAVIATFLSS